MTNTPPQIEIPFIGRWHYSRAETIADGIVHGVGIVLAIAAGSALLALAAFRVGPANISPPPSMSCRCSPCSRYR